ncbi:hypothetical protein, partial [Gordonibacter sp.]|uniref:hypothetical protein n=1 Tax=Gordonibacter sp. TaxID=1968902 RepID=UPI002FC8E00B
LSLLFIFFHFFSFRKKIHGKPRAAMLVHTYGQPRPLPASSLEHRAITRRNKKEWPRLSLVEKEAKHEVFRSSAPFHDAPALHSHDRCLILG